MDNIQLNWGGVRKASGRSGVRIIKCSLQQGTTATGLMMLDARCPMQ